MMFRKLKLFQQLSIIIFSILMLGFAIVMLGIGYYFNDTVNSNRQALHRDLIHASNIFIDSTSKRLAALSLTNSIWNDALYHTNKKDKTWIDRTLIKYLTQGESFLVDFAYINNTENGFKSKNGVHDSKMIELIDGIDKTQFIKNKRSSVNRILFLNDIAYIIAITPLCNDDYKNYSGFLALGYRIDTNLKKEMSRQFEREASVNTYLQIDGKIKNTVMTINDFKNDEEILKFDIGKINYDNEIRNIINFLFISVIIVSMIGLLLLSRVMKKMDRNVTHIVKNINQISHGIYDDIVDISVSSDFDQISNSISRLSSTLKEKEEHIESTYIEMISMLIKAIEEVDMYTKGHSERVSIYSSALALEMGYEYCELIRLSGLLHDVGKISIDTSILNKPGKLTSLEFEQIKKHPSIGHSILDMSPLFENTKDVVLYHHERYDGSGYPDGLKGFEIPVSAQIVAIADVFDALTSERSYRKELSIDDALGIMTDMVGTHFEPSIFYKFEVIAHSAYEYAKKYSEKTSYVELLRSNRTIKNAGV